MDNIVLAKHISWQKLPGKEAVFVYNIKTRLYYYFEDTELFIWNLLVNETSCSSKSIIQSCSIYYDIDSNEIHEDIEAFLESLSQIGVIENG